MTTLIESDADPRILEAASGLRPPITDDDLLPSQRVKFAPSSATYQVSRAGKGTQVTLYGTEEHGHSIAVRAEGFRPYLYISTEAIARSASTPESFKAIIARLLTELNQQLLLSSALQQKKDRPWLDPAEVVAFRESVAGYVEDRASGRGQRALTLMRGRKHCSPIVAHEYVMGTALRGTGPGCGYRGMDQTRFLKIYFYCPSLVAKARSILQGKNATLGAVAQAQSLARGRSTDVAAQDMNAEKPLFRNGTRVGRAHADKSQSRLCPERMDAMEMGSDDEEDVDELEDALEQLDIAKECLDIAAEGDEVEILEQAETLTVEGVRVDVETTVYLPPPETDAISDDDDEADTSDEKAARQTFIVDEDVSEARKRELELRVAERFGRMARKTALEKPLALLGPGMRYDVYEADIDFVLRFAIDCGFAYESWIYVDAAEELHTHPNGKPSQSAYVLQRVTGRRRETRLQIELLCDYRLLHFDAADPIQNTMANHLWVSLDCEMAPGPRNEFPVPERNSMLQCVFIIRGKKARASPDADADEKKRLKNKFEYRSVSFTLLDCDGSTPQREFCTERILLGFRSERTLFSAMARFVRALDPHIVSGYNSDHFDLPYMLDRAHQLGGGREFCFAWGRSVRASAMTVRERSFQSAQAGKIEFTDVQAPGLVMLDLLKKFQRDPGIKLRSYSLNAVALEFIGDQKEDISYALINAMQSSGPTDRERLRSYCEKDSLLVLEIAEVQKILPGMIEMSRITRVPLEILLNRGQQVRAKAALYDKSRQKKLGYIFYTRTDEERAADILLTIKGAQVQQPRPGIYKRVIVLDWNALYPSLQRTHNLCTSTLVDRSYDLTRDPYIQRCADPVNELTLEERQRRAAEAVFEVPDMVCEHPYREEPNAGSFRFLKHSIKVGLMPLVQEDYSNARDKAKAEMAAAYKAGDDAMGDLLNNRQLAYKLQANSLYGISASTTSFIFTPPVGDTITRRGRCDWFLMASEIRTVYADYEVDIVYGDTDSVFVSVGRDMSMEELCKLGVQMAAHITNRMKQLYTLDKPEYNVLKLAFEKAYSTIVIKAKKRYAGLKYEYNAKTGLPSAYPEPGYPSMSGFESKRRDVTLLISKMVPDVLALLLDDSPGTTLEENLERMRAYTWQHMVRPLLSGTINLRDLIVTKQLRQLPSDYRASSNGAALPIHVQLAETLIERAGGEQAQNAPKAGVRLPYVVKQGAKNDKVSSLGEDPVYALDNNVPIDARYYLDSHIRPTLLGILVPVFSMRKTQAQLDTNSGISGVDLQVGKTEKQRKALNEKVAAQFLFGHPIDYIDPVSEEVRLRYANLIPATRRKDPPRKQWPRYIARRDTSTTIVPSKTGKQRTLSAFMPQGARCRSCKQFFPNEPNGFVCYDCSAAGTVKTDDLVQKYVSDIEELYAERRELVDTCQKCMGCAEAPKKITCTNTDCRVFWDRKQSSSSLKEAERRLEKVYAVACESGVLDKLEL